MESKTHMDNSADKSVRIKRKDDHGNGIPKEELERIWDKYYTNRRREGKGVSGLGLAIVRQTAVQHNGIWGAESETGRGSTFYIGFGKV